MKQRSEAAQTLRAGCKGGPKNKHTDRGDYNTLRSLARSVSVTSGGSTLEQCRHFGAGVL